WKRQQSLIRTLEWRPDLLEKANLSKEDQRFLEAYLKDKDRSIQDNPQ
ncbi:MAG: tRNA (guanosine(37)-N1)-methyltransferase TrmD, partial [Chloroflexi bacterium]|nr:tRNA (guanosine(37)-N1)-methyltransferase TrmD [Chloroflexota bacterium]